MSIDLAYGRSVEYGRLEEMTPFGGPGRDAGHDRVGDELGVAEMRQRTRPARVREERPP